MAETPTHVILPAGSTENAVYLNADDDLTSVVTALIDTGVELDEIAVYELRRKNLRIAKVELDDK